MNVEVLDEQTETADPRPADETATHDTGATGATEKSPDSPDANSGLPSKPQDEKKVLTKSDAMDILGKGLPKQGADENEDAADTSDAAKTEAEKAEADRLAKEKDDAAKSAAETETGSDVPFHKRPEWQALTALGEETAKKVRPILRKVLERETALSSQLNQARPDLDAVKELRGYAGDENGFKFMQQVVRAFAQGDPRGIPVMEKMLEQMKIRNGMVVQSPDLKAKLAKIDEAVEQNQITPEDAQERKSELLEVEKARAGQTRTQAELQQERKRIEQQQQEQQSKGNEAALNDWETSIRTKDPDFGNVTEESDENHGVSIADQVFTELQARLSAKSAANQSELVSTAQKAYETVKRRMSQFAPKPRAMKPVTSEHSSRTAKVKPKSFKEAAESATGILYGSES